jgi:hypothetical protein
MRGLRRGPEAALCLGLQVRNPPGACVCYLLWSISFCDWQIPRPEESYQVCAWHWVCWSVTVAPKTSMYKEVKTKKELCYEGLSKFLGSSVVITGTVNQCVTERWKLASACLYSYIAVVWLHRDILLSVSVIVPSKDYVCSHLIAGIVASNPLRGCVFVSCVCYLLCM